MAGGSVLLHSFFFDVLLKLRKRHVFVPVFAISSRRKIIGLQIINNVTIPCVLRSSQGGALMSSTCVPFFQDVIVSLCSHLS